MPEEWTCCRVTAQVIDEDLESLSRDELEGGWRSLCAMMLLRTANLLTAQMLGNKDFIHQKQMAMKWLDSGDGVISFSTACDSLSMDQRQVRGKMATHAASRQEWPINKTGSPRLVFGKGPPPWATQTNSRS